MDKKREDFLVRLRETFRVEAAEHLEAMTAGLLAIERASEAELAVIVERIFREAHSLKGAARSVGLAEAEALCQELENIFAAMKRKELTLSTERLDAVHSAIGLLATLCKSPGAPPLLQDQERREEALAALQQMVIGTAEKPASAPAVAIGPLRSPVAAEAVLGELGTIRVSTQKLSALLLEAEELLGAKITGSARAAELSLLVSALANWNQQRIRLATRQRRGHGGTLTVPELLDSELLYTKTFENSLRKLVGFAHQDALALAAISDRLLDDTKKMLLHPCSYLLGPLPKVVRDLARESGKEIDLLVDGEDIEIDRRVLDELKDPLIHMLRNSVDHGIEKPDARRELGKPSRGSVTITVKPFEGNRVELTVADDGAGIDAEKVRQVAVRLGLIAPDASASLTEAEETGLIFHSGLSTSPIITDLSGRGLGLAIVREKIEKLGGTIGVSSAPGGGATFRLLVPLSLATFRGVFVDVAGQRFVIPTANVERVGRVKPGEIKTVENRQVIAMGEHPVSLVPLRDVLELSGPDARAHGATHPVVVVRAADRQVAFLVDEVQGEREVLVKNLGKQLVRVRNISGAAISGSGAIIPILNVVDLMETASLVCAPGSIPTAQETPPERRRRLLVAEDSITARTLLKNILEGGGFEVVTAVDGLDALTRLKAETFDLLVSDVDMPRMNGFELTTKIRADKKIGKLPVALVTALESQKDREYGIEVGANAYIVKSDFDQSNLLEIIRRLL